MTRPKGGDPVQRKLRLLQLAEELGNVSDACRRAGYSRQQFYQIRKAFREAGVAGLVDRPPGPRRPHPNRVGAEIETRIVEVSAAHPGYGSRRIAGELRAAGLGVGAWAVRGVWARRGLAHRHDRARDLMARVTEEAIELDPEQRRALEWFDPEYRNRDVALHAPGERVAAHAFVVPSTGGVERALLHVVLDCFSRYAWARIYADRRPLTAVQVLAREALPAFQHRELPVWTVTTDRSGAFYGRAERHPFTSFVRLQGIAHIPIKSDGFVERFQRIVRSEYHGPGGCHPTGGTLVEMNEALEGWLVGYNESRPHDGAGMLGRTPGEVFRGRAQGGDEDSRP